MDRGEAAGRLEDAQRARRRSATSGVWVVTLVASAAVLAVGVVADLEMWWLSGLVILGLAGMWAARPVRSRFDWSNRLGTGLLIGGGALALAAYIAVQFPVRASDWAAPNTIGALAAVVVILAVCRSGMQRMADAAPSTARRLREAR